MECEITLTCSAYLMTSNISESQDWLEVWCRYLFSWNYTLPGMCLSIGDIKANTD